MEQNSSVTVLLSTFDGSKYVGAQICSLLRQTHQISDIVVRDDGSSDSTPVMLARFANNNPSIKIKLGRNIGAVASFFELIDLIPKGTDYVAFCDQDDVWDEDKVERGVRLLNAVPGCLPAMCFTNLRVVDAALRDLGAQKKRVPRGPAFENALVENVCTGCTIMFNARAADLLRARSVDHSNVIMHDWWAYQVIAALGHVSYDARATVHYRQHEKNLVGIASGLSFWTGRIKRHLRDSPLAVRKQANELLRVYGDELPEDRKSVLEDFIRCLESATWLERTRYALSTPVFRQSRLDDFILKALIIGGRV